MMLALFNLAASLTTGAAVVTDTVPLPIVSEEVSFVAAGRTIPGTLVHPESGQGPGLLILAGSGPTDRDWNSPLLPGTNGSARLIAEALAARGITVLRFDKAFSGKNRGLPISDLTLDTYLEEASAALALLRSRREVDPTRIFVAGHSEGGIHATRLVAAHPDWVRGLILLSAPGRSMRELLESQLEQGFRVGGMSPLQVDSAMGPIRSALADFVAGQAVDPKTASTNPQIVAVLGAMMAPPVAKIGRALISFEPAEAAANLQAPMLVVQGGKDVQVDPVADAGRLVSHRQAAGRPVEYYFSPLADHVLKEERRSLEDARANLASVQAGYNAQDRSLADGLIEKLADWMGDQGPKDH